MENQIDRINALTNNARNTWFVLLGALIFVGVTLMQVEPIDFFGVDRATQLPLVSVSVPTRLFFYAAPFLVAAVYGYFHLYLIRLWDVLGQTPYQTEHGEPLSEAIQPWLVSDAALHFRSYLRGGEPCTRPHALEWPAAVLNFGLAWAFGPLVLFYMWWQSLPARTMPLTLIITAMLGLCLMVGAASFNKLLFRMGPFRPWEPNVWTSGAMMSVGVVLIYFLIPASITQTARFSDNVAPLVLTGERLVQRPEGWLPPLVAEKTALAKWCELEGKSCSVLTAKEKDAFQSEWDLLRKNAISELKKPGFNPLRFDQLTAVVASALGQELAQADTTNQTTFDTINAAIAKQSVRAPDFRNADLNDSFLVGANLLAARMQGVQAQNANLELANMAFADLRNANLAFAVLFRSNLSLAQMQGADLRHAQMQRTILRGAQMQGADLSNAQMQSANLRRTQMQGAILREAQLQGATLLEANLQKANLRRANLQGAKFSWAQMQDADLWEADMRRAVLRGARMQGAILWKAKLRNVNLRDAQMQGAVLRQTQMQEANMWGALMERADLSGAQMQGANFWDAQMQGTNWSFSLLAGRPDMRDALWGSSLAGSVNLGGAVREMDLTVALFDKQSDWKNAFLDASVDVPPDLRRWMGNPCQWRWAETYRDDNGPLSNVEFFGLWRGWWERSDHAAQQSWEDIAPQGWHDVRAVAPPPGCKWKK